MCPLSIDSSCPLLIPNDGTLGIKLLGINEILIGLLLIPSKSILLGNIIISD